MPALLSIIANGISVPTGGSLPNQNTILINIIGIILQDMESGSSSSRICLIALSLQLFIAFTERKKKVPFSMAIGNGELMHECFPKHSLMGTARMK